jgi:hypothetical protein
MGDETASVGTKQTRTWSLESVNKTKRDRADWMWKRKPYSELCSTAAVSCTTSSLLDVKQWIKHATFSTRSGAKETTENSVGTQLVLTEKSYTAGPVWGETMRKSMLRFCVYHTNLNNFKTITHIQISNTRFKRARMKECYATLTFSAWRHTQPQDGRQFGVENYRFAARQN